MAEGYIEDSVKSKMEVANMLLSTHTETCSASNDADATTKEEVTPCQNMCPTLTSASFALTVNSNCTINI